MTNTTLPDDDPLGCGPDWRRAVSSPHLHAVDPVAAMRAAGRLAIATGRCRLFGVVVPILSTDIAVRASDNLLLRVADLTASAKRLGDFFDARDRPGETEEVCLDLLHSRMDLWAGCVALIEASHDVPTLAPGLDRLIDAVANCDQALQEHAELLAVAAQTALLDNWRGCLADEFAQTLPWWMDGTPERWAAHAKESIERQIRAWQQWVRAARRVERPMAARPSWLPEYLPTMAMARPEPPPAPGQAVFWDEPSNGRTAEMVLPTRFADRQHEVTLLFRRADRSLADELSGPLELAGVAGTIDAGVARFTAQRLEQAHETLTLLVGAARIEWPRRAA